MIDVFPGEWVGTYHEKEIGKTVDIGDKVKVIVESSFTHNDLNRKNMIGIVIELDPGDEWGYRVSFDDGFISWFKRYHLEKIED